MKNLLLAAFAVALIALTWGCTKDHEPANELEGTVATAAAVAGATAVAAVRAAAKT
jgi:hypothetical protein